jgi:hypothetical protein
MSGALDAIARFVMLVLAGLVSLSIIGAIAAMSSAGGPRPAAPPPEAVRIAPAEPQAEAPAAPAPGSEVTSNGVGVPVVTVAQPEQPDPAEKWLEAIAYALMAITGLLALIALILWRGLSLLRDR